MLSNALSPQHVIAYAFSAKLATLKMMISLTKMVHIELCMSRSITCLIPKFAELHGGVIICFMNPRVYEILLQMFRLTFCVVFIYIYIYTLVVRVL